MSTSTTNRWKLGLFVIASFFALIAVALWLGARRFKSDTLTAYVYFDEPVTGLEAGSPIRFRGMTIGSVAEIRVAPDRHHLEVACTIDVAKLEQIGLREPGEVAREGAQVPATLRAQIERSFVTGVAFIQTDFFDPARYPPEAYPFAVPETIVHSVPSPQKSLQRALDDLLERLPRLLDRSEQVLTAIHDELVAAELPAIGAELRGALEDLRAAMREVGWGELDAEARETLDGLQATLADVKTLFDGDDAPFPDLVGQTRRVVERLDGELARADLPGTTAALRGLMAGVGAATPEVRSLLPALQRAAESFRRLTDLLERDPASLVRGRAMPNDPRSGR